MADSAGWTLLDTFHGNESNEPQRFTVNEPKQFTKYIRLTFFEHVGSEYYCPVTTIEVFGVTMIEEYHFQRHHEDEVEVEGSGNGRLAADGAATTLSAETRNKAPDSATPEISGGVLSNLVGIVGRVFSGKQVKVVDEESNPGVEPHAIQGNQQESTALPTSDTTRETTAENTTSYSNNGTLKNRRAIAVEKFSNRTATEATPKVSLGAVATGPTMLAVDPSPTNSPISDEFAENHTESTQKRIDPDSDSNMKETVDDVAVHENSKMYTGSSDAQQTLEPSTSATPSAVTTPLLGRPAAGSSPGQTSVHRSNTFSSQSVTDAPAVAKPPAGDSTVTVARETGEIGGTGEAGTEDQVQALSEVMEASPVSVVSAVMSKRSMEGGVIGEVGDNITEEPPLNRVSQAVGSKGSALKSHWTDCMNSTVLCIVLGSRRCANFTPILKRHRRRWDRPFSPVSCSLAGRLLEVQRLPAKEATKPKQTISLKPKRPLPTPGGERSIFSQLKNQIKALERNMTISGRFLESLAGRYKKLNSTTVTLMAEIMSLRGHLNRSGDGVKVDAPRLAVLEAALVGLYEAAESAAADLHSAKASCNGAVDGAGHGRRPKLHVDIFFSACLGAFVGGGIWRALRASGLVRD